MFVFAYGVPFFGIVWEDQECMGLCKWAFLCVIWVLQSHTSL